MFNEIWRAEVLPLSACFPGHNYMLLSCIITILITLSNCENEHIDGSRNNANDKTQPWTTFHLIFKKSPCKRRVTFFKETIFVSILRIMLGTTPGRNMATHLPKRKSLERTIHKHARQYGDSSASSCIIPCQTRKSLVPYMSLWCLPALIVIPDAHSISCYFA